MDSNEYFVCDRSRAFRLVSFFLIFLAIEVATLNELEGKKTPEVNSYHSQPEKLDLTIASFDQLEKKLNSAPEILQESRQFLENLLTEINTINHSNMTLQNLCKLAESNFDSLGIPLEFQRDLSIIIDLFQLENVKPFSGAIAAWQWPFGRKKYFIQPITTLRSNIDELPGQLTSGTIVGGVEILAGLAIGYCCGVTVVGGVVAGGLIADGIHRMADQGQTDIEQALRERRIRTDTFE